jgi:hypothetical protein
VPRIEGEVPLAADRGGAVTEAATGGASTDAAAPSGESVTPPA